jgi:hypothetical protein
VYLSGVIVNQFVLEDLGRLDFRTTSEQSAVRVVPVADLHPILATRDQAAAIGQLIRSTGETDLGAGVVSEGDSMTLWWCS